MDCLYKEIMFAYICKEFFSLGNKLSAICKVSFGVVARFTSHYVNK